MPRRTVTNMDDGTSTCARLLAASGFLGVAGSFGLRLTAELLLDPILGGVSRPPDWIEPVSLALFAGSVVVVLYALLLDDVFPGWGDVLAAAALLAQWGLPVGMLLVAEQFSSPYLQLVVHASAVLHVLVAAVVAGNVAVPR